MLEGNPDKGETIMQQLICDIKTAIEDAVDRGCSPDNIENTILSLISEGAMVRSLVKDDKDKNEIHRPTT